MASAMPGVRATRTTPRPSARTPAATAAASGPRRTVSSRLQQHEHRPAVLVGQRAGRRRQRRRHLAAEGAAVGQRATPARRPARTTTRRSRGRPARPTTCAASRAQSPSGQLERRRRRRRCVRRPCTLPAAARASASVSPTAQPPCAVGHGDERTRPARCRRRRPPRRGRRSAPTAWATPPSSAARPAAAAGSRPAHGSIVARRRRPARRRRRSAASRCTGTGGRAAPARRPPLRSHRRRPRRAAGRRCPGVQKPHWLPPVAQSASAQRPASGRAPSAVVTDRPATRRTGVTHATRGWPSTSTVQQPHWPCGLHPSLAERTPRWSRSASSSEPPSSGTSTGAPSTTRATTWADCRRPPGRTYRDSVRALPTWLPARLRRRPPCSPPACGDDGDDDDADRRRGGTDDHGDRTATRSSSARRSTATRLLVAGIAAAGPVRAVRVDRRARPRRRRTRRGHLHLHPGGAARRSTPSPSPATATTSTGPTTRSPPRSRRAGSWTVDRRPRRRHAPWSPTVVGERDRPPRGPDRRRRCRWRRRPTTADPLGVGHDLHRRTPPCPLPRGVARRRRRRRAGPSPCWSRRRRTARSASAARCSTCSSTPPTPDRPHGDPRRGLPRQHRPATRATVVPGRHRHLRADYEPVAVRRRRDRHGHRPARQHLRRHRAGRGARHGGLRDRPDGPRCRDLGERRRSTDERADHHGHHRERPATDAAPGRPSRRRTRRPPRRATAESAGRADRRTAPVEAGRRRTAPRSCGRLDGDVAADVRAAEAAVRARVEAGRLALADDPTTPTSSPGPRPSAPRRPCRRRSSPSRSPRSSTWPPSCGPPASASAPRPGSRGPPGRGWRRRPASPCTPAPSGGRRGGRRGHRCGHRRRAGPRRRRRRPRLADAAEAEPGLSRQAADGGRDEHGARTRAPACSSSSTRSGRRCSSISVPLGLAVLAASVVAGVLAARKRTAVEGLTGGPSMPASASRASSSTSSLPATPAAALRPRPPRAPAVDRGARRRTSRPRSSDRPTSSSRLRSSNRAGVRPRPAEEPVVRATAEELLAAAEAEIAAELDAELPEPLRAPRRPRCRARHRRPRRPAAARGRVRARPPHRQPAICARRSGRAAQRGHRPLAPARRRRRRPPRPRAGHPGPRPPARASTPGSPTRSPTVRTVAAFHRSAQARWRVLWASLGADEAPDPDELDDTLDDGRSATSDGAAPSSAQLEAAEARVAAPTPIVRRPLVLVEPQPRGSATARLGQLLVLDARRRATVVVVERRPLAEVTPATRPPTGRVAS